ncbi:hypothetical protein BGZ95_010138 [Linnemannia exigua]|uniref:Uncharacterized protein n=1 Tax=Linnemannia exigua TaxID=604196 RepID=A0AAD4H571_9FUNG|nr:hypothetical protein BGZ95_010138 [Linnemannia exigua]
MSSTSTPTPVVVTLPRPPCFCGYTSIAIYPDPIATTPSSTLLFSGKAGKKDPPPLKNNWVYECHFTVQQRGMVKPEHCDDCEEARRPRIPRHPSGLMGPSNLPAEQDSMQALSPNSDIPPSTTTDLKRPHQHKQHTAPHYDNVELWPRATPTTPSSSLDQQDYLSDKETVIGAQINQPSTFHGLSPLDHLRVCGFHMHALEWHHMQTVGIDQIIALAKQTGCGVFNLSVIRWLGEHIRKKLKSACTNTSTAIRTFTTGVKNKDIYKDVTMMTKGMDFTLFHKMGCLCKKEAALVRVPTTLGTSSSSTSASRRGTTSSPARNEQELWIVCRARAQVRPTFEILDHGREDHGSNKQMIAWYASASTTTCGSGSGSGSSRRGRQMTVATGVGPGIGNEFQECSFGIPLEIANFGHNRAPIHQKVAKNAWLSRWLSPPSHTHPPSPLPAGLKRAISAVKESMMTERQWPPPDISSTQGPRTTVRYLDENGWPLSTSSLYNDENEEQDSKDLRNSIYSNTQQNVGWDIGLPRIKQVPKKDDRSRDMKGLDKELQEVLTRHVAVLRSRIDTDEEGQSFEMLGDELSMSSRFYRRIDMEAISTVRFQLCKDCRDGMREFCVIPRHCLQPHYPSPLPSTASLDPLIQLDVDMDKDIDIGVELEAQVDLELEHIDKELEGVMTRYAEEVQRSMEARSRLIPFFLQCRACEQRQQGVDVVPCGHELLCGQCLDSVEFYVIPRKV